MLSIYVASLSVPIPLEVSALLMKSYHLSQDGLIMDGLKNGGRTSKTDDILGKWKPTTQPSYERRLDGVLS